MMLFRRWVIINRFELNALRNDNRILSEHSKSLARALDNRDIRIEELEAKCSLVGVSALQNEIVALQRELSIRAVEYLKDIVARRSKASER